MTNLDEEEARVKVLQIKLEKSIKTLESDLRERKKYFFRCVLNEKRILKKKKNY